MAKIKSKKEAPKEKVARKKVAPKKRNMKSGMCLVESFQVPAKVLDLVAKQIRMDVLISQMRGTRVNPLAVLGSIVLKQVTQGKEHLDADSVSLIEVFRGFGAETERPRAKREDSATFRVKTGERKQRKR